MPRKPYATLTIGAGCMDSGSLQRLLDHVPEKWVEPSAKDLLTKKFIPEIAQQIIDITLFRPIDADLCEMIPTQNFFSTAVSRGLQLCPMEIAPILFSEWVDGFRPFLPECIIAMNPIDGFIFAFEKNRLVQVSATALIHPITLALFVSRRIHGPITELPDGNFLMY